MLLALHREVALLPWVPLGTGVAAGLADAAVIAGHPMGYQDLPPDVGHHPGHRPHRNTHAPHLTDLTREG